MKTKNWNTILSREIFTPKDQRRVIRATEGSIDLTIALETLPTSHRILTSQENKIVAKEIVPYSEKEKTTAGNRLVLTGE